MAFDLQVLLYGLASFLQGLFFSGGIDNLFVGLLVLFFGSLLASATIFLPVPFYIIVFGLGAFAQQTGSLLLAVEIGLAAGIGAGIGEMTGYLVGRLGLKAVESKAKIDVGKIFDVESRLERHGAYAVFFLSIVPVPFDFVGMAAGLIGFDFRKFFAATVAGKAIRYLIIALAGYYGLGLVRGIFGF